MEPGHLYLDIAKRALSRLLKLKSGPATTPHYRHAVTCIVFSAVAVEHAIQRLIVCRIRLQSQGRYRRVLRAVWPPRPNVDQMIAFVRAATQVPKPLLDDVRKLFNDRNRIVHVKFFVHLEPKDDDYENPDVEWEESVGFPVVQAEWIEIAKRDIKIAEAAIAALRNAYTEEEWHTFK